MTYNRPIHMILPFEILWRTTDAKGDWCSWRVHSKHWSEDERDQEYEKLTSCTWRQYRKSDNEFELERQKEARERIGYDHNHVI